MTGQNKGPAEIPEAFSHRRIASTGQAVEPRVIAIVAPQALLIGFAPANFHAHPVAAKLEIFNVQGNELGTAKGAGKAEQENGAIAKSFQVGPSFGASNYFWVLGAS